MGHFAAGIEHFEDGDGGHITEVEITGGGLRPDIVVEKRGQSAGTDLVRTGDASFDDAVTVRGPERHMIAALDAATREALQIFVAIQHGSVDSGVVWTRTPRKVVSAEETDLLVARATSIATRLVLRAADLPERLAKNATADHHPSVCERNLRMLLDHYTRSPETEAACRATLLQPWKSWETQLLAATFLGREGLGTLRGIASSPIASPRTRIAAAEEVAFLGAGEVALLELLRDVPAEDRPFAARALGRVGSVAAVQPLRETGKAASLLAGRKLRRACQEAVAKIQARLDNPEAGRLSIVQAEGALSRVPDGGGVDLSDDDP